MPFVIMRTVYEPWYRLYCLPWAVVKRCYNSACFAGWHGESIMGLSGMGLGWVQRRNVHHVISSIPRHVESHAARAAACRHAKPTKGPGGKSGGPVRGLGHCSGHFPQQPSCPLEAGSGMSHTERNRAAIQGNHHPCQLSRKVLGSSH